MCGIVGFQSSQVYDKSIAQQMLDVIKHRGPDDEGIECVDDLTLGHVRLSIIDLEYGHQPMISADGRFTITFNGEIYNYVELKQHLSSKGYRLKTSSDTEVLLYMYIEYGKNVVEHLNGMFAFAVYDNKEKTTFIARDHFGIKPLYYYEGNSCFAFASEIKALLKHPEVRTAVDTFSLQEYLTFQFVLKKHTLFKDVHKLEPATYIIVKNRRIIEKKEYWTLNYDIDTLKTEEQFVDELLVLLENAVSIQLRSDVPVGAHLSGGLDSSAVSVLASKNYFGKLKTFTGGFKDSELYDETRYAKTVSRFIDSEYHEIFPGALDFIDSIEKLVYHMDEPGAGPGIFPQYVVSKLAAENIKVVMGGQGGDEIFGGYARYAVAYLEQCIKGAIFETQEEGSHVVTLHSIVDNLPLLRQYVPMIKSQFSRGMFETMDNRYFNLIDRSPSLGKIYSEQFLENNNKTELFDKFAQIFNKPDTPSYFNKMTYFDMKTLLPTLLQVEDRVSMAVSLESRVPLLDKRIVEFAAKLPPTLKFAGGKTKYILFKSLKNILPSEITSRKDKMGFPVPLNEWLKGELKDYFLDIFHSRKTIERGIFDTDKVIRQIDSEEKFSRDLWGALNIELWHRIFVDG